jgi:hypothetical protein
MHKTRATTAKLPKQAVAQSKAAGKSKVPKTSPLCSEAEESYTQVVGSSRKRKRTSTKSSSGVALEFAQFSPAMQKKLMKEALKALTQGKDASAEADAGM